MLQAAEAVVIFLQPFGSHSSAGSQDRKGEEEPLLASSQLCTVTAACW